MHRKRRTDAVGIADDTRAIAAFNARSIEMFIQKKTPVNELYTNEFIK